MAFDKSVYMYNGHHSCVMEQFYYPKTFPCALLPSVLSFSPHAPGNTDLLSVAVVFAFSRIHVNGIIHYAVLSFWLSPLSMALLRYVHVVRLSSLLLFLADWRPLARTHQKLLIHSPVDGHLIVNSLGLL